MNPKHYHGKPCLHGHTLRYRKGNACIECLKAWKARGGGVDPELRRFYGEAYSAVAKDRYSAILADLNADPRPTYAALARKYGISRTRVSQLVRRALAVR